MRPGPSRWIGYYDAASLYPSSGILNKKSSNCSSATTTLWKPKNWSASVKRHFCALLWLTYPLLMDWLFWKNSTGCLAESNVTKYCMLQRLPSWNWSITPPCTSGSTYSVARRFGATQKWDFTRCTSTKAWPFPLPYSTAATMLCLSGCVKWRLTLFTLRTIYSGCLQDRGCCPSWALLMKRMSCLNIWSTVRLPAILLTFDIWHRTNMVNYPAPFGHCKSALVVRAGDAGNAGFVIAAGTVEAVHCLKNWHVTG